MFAYISVSVLMLAISAQEGSVAFFALGRKRRGMGGDYYVLIVYLFIYIFHWTVWSYIVENNFVFKIIKTIIIILEQSLLEQQQK